MLEKPATWPTEIVYKTTAFLGIAISLSQSDRARNRFRNTSHFQQSYFKNSTDTMQYT